MSKSLFNILQDAYNNRETDPDNWKDTLKDEITKFNQTLDGNKKLRKTYFKVDCNLDPNDKTKDCMDKATSKKECLECKDPNDKCSGVRWDKDADKCVWDSYLDLTGKRFDKMLMWKDAGNALEELIRLINLNQVVLLEAGTGTGKSTAMPAAIVEAGLCPKNKKVVCTQPRRANADGISEYVGCLVGNPDAVGYKHGKGSDSGTKLMYMTEGILVQEILSDFDGFDKKYSHIIIDEVHERSINTDILLGLTKKLLNKQGGTDLKVIVTSATFDRTTYKNYFTKSPNAVKSIEDLYVAGKTPEIDQIDPELPINNMYEYITNLVEKIIADNPEEENENFRDILIFLESISSIRKLKELLTKKLNTDLYPVLIFTSGTSPEDQKKITEESDNFPEFSGIKRRIVIATNVAETGLTFDQLKHVIDSGWMISAVFNPMNNSQGLLRSHESQNNAMQRRGRVGRIEPGCYYPLFQFNKDRKKGDVLPKKLKPGIYYNSLSTSLLGIINIVNQFKINPNELTNIYDFDFMDQPPITTLHRNLSELYLLGALTRNLKLTKIGKMMNKLSRVPPQFAKAIIAAEVYHCTYEVAVIAACSSVIGSFYNFSVVPNNYTFNDFTDHQYRSDHINMLVTFMKYAAVRRTNSKLNTDKWCTINRLNSGPLNTAYEAVKQIMESLVKAEIPILSYNRNITQYTHQMKMNILKALFTGLFLNTGRLSSNIKFFKIHNWYGKDYYSEVYKGSSFYTGNFKIENLYPKNVFFGSVIMKARDGMYINYLTGGMSPYDPEWIGTLVPNLD